MFLCDWLCDKKCVCYCALLVAVCALCMWDCVYYRKGLKEEMKECYYLNRFGSAKYLFIHPKRERLFLQFNI